MSRLSVLKRPSSASGFGIGQQLYNICKIIVPTISLIHELLHYFIQNQDEKIKLARYKYKKRKENFSEIKNNK